VALIGGVLAAVSRVFGRVANTALGWATVLLFGRVAQSRQMLLTAVTLGSLIWLLVLVGVLLPNVGTVLLAAVPRPSFVPELWVRLAMLVAAVALPLLIGVATIFLLDPARRPSGAGLVTQVLRGYPYAAVLAVTIVFLAVVVLVRKARSLVRRWEDAHVPVIVKPGHYDEVVDALERALDDAGLAVDRRAAPRVLEVPARLLGLVGGAGVRSLVPDRLAELKARDLEILVHPSDVAILGGRTQLARARAALATRLTHSEAWLTTTHEAQEVEDRLLELSRAPDPTAEDFAAIDRRLASLVVPASDWDTLYRERLQIENERRLPDASSPASPGTDARATERASTPAVPDAVRWAAAGTALALLAADVAVGLIETLRGRRRSST
jgi:hypothetical protein